MEIIKKITANIVLYGAMGLVLIIVLYYLWYKPLSKFNGDGYEYIIAFLVINVFYLGMFKVFEYIGKAIDWSLKQLGK